MRVKLLSSYVDVLTKEETVVKINDAIQNKTALQHVVINANKINLMYRDKKLQKIVNECPIINADGISILLAAKFLGLPKIERVTGIDLFTHLLGQAVEKKHRIYLLGAEEGVLKEVINRGKRDYPGIQFVGSHHGYFSEETAAVIAKEISQSAADLVFVAFSSPQKEYWIHENIHRSGSPVMIGVGGSFDVYAGKSKRAPKWLQQIGFEWFYRFLQEPRRLFRRYFIGNSLFIWHLLKAKFSKNGENIE